MTDKPIRIKRYPNRRFYASHTSKYVSLTDIEQMIHDGMTVEIVDSQTDDDLTRAVLVQIIAERHPDKIAMFPTGMLHSILRANDVMVDFLQDYFRNSLAYVDHFQKHGAPGPLQEPIHWTKTWLDNWSVRPPGNPQPRSTAEQESVKDEHPLDERIAQLERRIAELEEERNV